MIEFKTDTQTVNDLNLLPKFRGDISIFNFFNTTKTKGGYNALVHLMESPSNDLNEVLNRVEMIKFADRIKEQIIICLNDNQLDIIEYYLNQNTITLRDNYIDALFDRISYFIRPNNDYYITSNALEYIGNHILKLKELIDKAGSNPPAFILELDFEIQKVMSDTDLKGLVKKSRKKLFFRQINRFDSLIRKKYTELLYGIIRKTYLLDAYLSVNNCSTKNKIPLSRYKKIQEFLF